MNSSNRVLMKGSPGLFMHRGNLRKAGPACRCAIKISNAYSCLSAIITAVQQVLSSCALLPMQECEDIPVTKIVKKCKNTCDENAAEVKITKKAVDTHFYVSAPKHGRRLFNDPKDIVKALVGGKKGEACKEVCKDVEEEDVEEECKEKTKMKEKCEEVVEEKCEKEKKPFCKTECAVTCKPKLVEAVAGAAGLVVTAGAADAAPEHPGLLGVVAKHLG